MARNFEEYCRDTNLFSSSHSPSHVHPAALFHLLLKIFQAISLTPHFWLGFASNECRKHWVLLKCQLTFTQDTFA